MKTISIFLALVNALLAGLLIASSLSFHELSPGQVWWLVAKIAAAICVILVGVLTWVGSASNTRPGLMPLCSLFLVALGAATVVWTFHIALVRSDLEFHMIVYGCSLAVQGMASLLDFAEEARSVTI